MKSRKRGYGVNTVDLAVLCVTQTVFEYFYIRKEGSILSNKVKKSVNLPSVLNLTLNNLEWQGAFKKPHSVVIPEQEWKKLPVLFLDESTCVSHTVNPKISDEICINWSFSRTFVQTAAYILMLLIPGRLCKQASDRRLFHESIFEASENPVTRFLDSTDHEALGCQSDCDIVSATGRPRLRRKGDGNLKFPHVGKRIILFPVLLLPSKKNCETELNALCFNFIKSPHSLR